MLSNSPVGFSGNEGRAIALEAVRRKAYDEFEFTLSTVSSLASLFVVRFGFLVTTGNPEGLHRLVHLISESSSWPPNGGFR